MTRPEPRRVRAVFFDAGFTLIYADPPQAVRYAEVARAHGVDLTAAQLERVLPEGQLFFYHSLRDQPDIWAADSDVIRFWRRYYAHLFALAGLPPSPALEQAADALYQIYNEPGAWALYPDVLSTVEILHRQGYRLGVISDWGTRLAHRVLLPLGLGRYFDFMVVSASVGTAKPGQPLYDEALRRAQVAPHEAVHIGDSYIADVLGARTAGITPILLDRHNRAGAVDCLKVQSLAELPALLAELDGRA